VAADQFGASVALSSDGNTALVGAPNKTTGTGAAYVFTRSGSTWTQQKELTATGGAHGDLFGTAVGLSSDGNTAAISAPGKSTKAGTVYVFTRSGSTWTQATSVVPSDAASNAQFGNAVSVSGDGGTIMVGDDQKASKAGAVYVFTGSGSTWTQQTKLTISTGVANDMFGSAVSLDNNGMIALVGAQGEQSAAGGGYIFTRSGSTWTNAAPLASSNNIAGSGLGASASISSDGTTAVLGAPGQKKGVGSALAFTGSGAKWQREPKLSASDGAVGDALGTSVAVSSNGTTVLAGADGSNSGTGAGYVFTTSLSPPKPKVEHVSPSHGKVGSAVTINGSNFTGATAVAFGGVNQPTFTIVNDGQITTTVPANAVTGPVSVTGPGGTGSSPNPYKVKPVITSFTPPSGAVGTKVTINGTGFAGTTAVTFTNGVTATFTIVNSTQLTATVPTGAVTGKITVTTSGGGKAKSATGFTVTP